MRTTVPDPSPAREPVQPRRWLKADLHLHTAEDPCDVVDPPAAELLELAAARGFHVIAITLHGTVLQRQDLTARARELGILLLPGAELRVEGADVIILNLSPEEAAATRTFGDLRRLRARRGDSLFVLAPHPFYPAGASLRRARLEANRDCFDAMELCHLAVPLPAALNPNALAARFALRHDLPLVATSDAHTRRAFGAHFTLVDLEAGRTPDAETLFAALRAGNSRPVRPPGRLRHLIATLWFLFVVHPWRKRGRRRQRDRGKRAGSISLCPSQSVS